MFCRCFPCKIKAKKEQKSTLNHYLCSKNTEDMNRIDYLMLSSIFDHEHTRTMERSVLLNDNMDMAFDLNSDSQLASGSPKRIDFATIMICTQGRMTLKLNLMDYEVRPGDVLILAPSTIGQDVLVTPDCQLCMICFSEEVYNETSKNTISQQLRNYILRDPAKIHLSADYLQMAIAHYRLMRQLMGDEHFAYLAEAIRAHVTVLSALFVQCIEEERSHQTELSHQERLFNRFLQDVREHHHESRQVSFYADRLCISAKYLSHVVKDISGRQPMEWIRDYVLLNAKTLLRSGQYSVQQVSELLAFPNPSFFGKYFREHVGCTPREYQMQGSL